MEAVTLYSGTRIDQVDLTDCQYWELRDPVRPEDLVLEDPESQRLREGFRLWLLGIGDLLFRVLIRTSDGRYVVVAPLRVPANAPRTGPAPKTTRHQEVSRATARRLLLQSQDPADLSKTYDLPDDLRDLALPEVELRSPEDHHDESGGVEHQPRKRKRTPKGEARSMLLYAIESAHERGDWGLTDTQLIEQADISRSTFYMLTGDGERGDQEIRKRLQAYRRDSMGRGPVRHRDA